MNLALWIIAIALAAVFAGSGLMKQFVPKDKLVTSGQGWAQDFSPTSITGDGRCGRGERSAQRSANDRSECGAAGARRRRRPGPFRAVFVYAVTKFHTHRPDTEIN
jgi:uncharacterized low-complexity protein